MQLWIVPGIFEASCSLVIGDSTVYMLYKVKSKFSSLLPVAREGSGHRLSACLRPLLPALQENSPPRHEATEHPGRQGRPSEAVRFRVSSGRGGRWSPDIFVKISGLYGRD